MPTGFSRAPFLAVFLATLLATACREPDLQTTVLQTYSEYAAYSPLYLHYPLDGTLFPPDIVAPTFRWEDPEAVDTWVVVLDLQEPPERLGFHTQQPTWTPPDPVWESFKLRSVKQPARVAVVGVNSADPTAILSGNAISIGTSEDEVGAPLFYRDVAIPFVEAVKDPSVIRWRFGEISSKEQPAVVLDELPICGNCHSFSVDGKVLGMDVDFANDKGSYAVVDVEEEMVLDRSRILTWSDYEGETADPTFGLLSQISPDGRYVVSTVEDRSVFVVAPGLAFSQLFFPIQGILAVYSRQTGEIRALPGADDPEFVQSNPTWSPDGEYIVFARAEAYRLENLRRPEVALLTPEEAHEFTEEGKTFQYDLYRIPFNEGRGGVPEPLAGAFDNGMSNYFPKYSPDGKWIVFCKAKSYMLLQPDSELYIVPAGGGEARRLEANTRLMNSWHSWSPNSRWLVFSSKANTPYTQLFLTHIDEAGQSSPPVLLEHFVASDRAANIPEFVNTDGDAIRRIREQFVDDVSHVRTAYANLVVGDTEGAIRGYRKALELNPENTPAHVNLGTLLFLRGEHEEAEHHLSEALRLDPANVEARVNLGALLFERGRIGEAETLLREALEIAPNDAMAHRNLGHLVLTQRRFDDAVVHYARAVELEPDDPDTLRSLAWVLSTAPESGLRDGARALELAKRACELTHHRAAPPLDTLAAAHAESGEFEEATSVAVRAMFMARASGDHDLARQIEGRLLLYEKARPYRLDRGP
ncbi:MAG: tetratricopeptide repeat protein [Deltaproteobacteria bacterium]|nr:tetratricopeptide repeat protein [Deltaproteobacteria bacterium]